MKKTLFMFAALVMLATSASAQFSNSKSSRASSDDSRGAIGVNVTYGTEVGNIGFGVKGQYRFIDQFRGEAAFEYFLKKDNVSAWDVNVNLHYLIPVANNLKVYPLAGVTYMRVISHFETSAISSYSSEPNPFNYSSEAAYLTALENYYNYLRGGESSSTTSSDGHFGANLGAGIEYDLSDSWKIGFETKYQIIGKGFSQVAFTVGAAYKF
jgi:outer membrane protein X